jgi:hypothetical protein
MRLDTSLAPLTSAHKYPLGRSERGGPILQRSRLSCEGGGRLAAALKATAAPESGPEPFDGNGPGCHPSRSHNVIPGGIDEHGIAPGRQPSAQLL